MSRVWVKGLLLVILSFCLFMLCKPFEVTANTHRNYFQVVQNNVTIYEKDSGKLVPVGSLVKGQVYARIKDYGSWYQIQYGNGYGYVWKKATIPVSRNIPKDITSNAKKAGTINLRTDRIVYAAGHVPIAVLKKDHKYPIIGQDSHWWTIRIAERKAYVYKSDMATKDFESNDHFFKVTANNVTVYDNSTGKLLPMGTLENGKIYPRVRDIGNWHQIIFAGKAGFVWKGATIPVNLNNAVYVPIITYHNFTTKLSNGENISPDRFLEQVKYLKAKGYTTITFDQLLNFINGTGQLPKKPLMITMDDSLLSQYTVAYPILKSLGMKGTIFAIVDSIGGSRGSLQEFSWDQAREMEQSGVIDIESHTFHLHYNVSGHPAVITPLPGETQEQYSDRITNDLLLAKTTLEKQLNKQVLGLAYPYGKWNETAKMAAEKAGYKAVFLYREGTGLSYQGMDPLMIDRFGVNGNQSPADVVRMITK